MQDQNLKKYLIVQARANTAEEITISLLGGGKSQSHLNYKVITPKETFVARVTKPQNLLSYPNLSDEYTVLKYVEPYNVGPQALHIDLEKFDTPLLLEQYFDGTLFTDLENADEDVFGTAIDLIVRTSQIHISQDEFPFKYTYTTYRTNFRTWDMRIKEIGNLSKDSNVVRQLTAVAQKARTVLEAKENILCSTEPEFIYNDVHSGNMFLLKTGEVRFIDWQKVSLGDPSFMLALFAKRFGKIWNLDSDAFMKKSLKTYAAKKKLPANFQDLLLARMLERTVSDAIWVVWADVRSGESNVNVEDNRHLKEAKALLD